MSFAFCPNCGAKVEAETFLSSGGNTVGGASLTSQTSHKLPSPSEPTAHTAKQFPTFKQFPDSESQKSGGAILRRQKIQSKAAARQPSI